jgi:FkbH-like protein
VSIPQLRWLPENADWIAEVKRLERADTVTWSELVSISNTRLDFMRTDRVDRLLQRHVKTKPPGLATKPVRLAVLASSTTVHLTPAIRVGALRRNIWLTTYEVEYGQYRHELMDPDSPLYAFKPDTVLFALDARHVTAGFDPSDDAATVAMAFEQLRETLRHYWHIARSKLGATVLQQAVLPVLPTLMGGNEHALPGAPAGVVARLNDAIRQDATQAGIVMLALDAQAAQDGLRAWHDPELWHRAKQEVSPVASPVYGDLVARLVAAVQGRSAKCLVLDLDNTLWGGVIGDDGLEGLALGQGSALGEAFVAVQTYAKQLAKRGVILAVCSKNDEANALACFEHHPEMVLKRSDIASFFANWDDKATNLRRIAADLNIGLDSLVFLDDNPFERNLVRQELPEIAVPEVPDDDPAMIPQLLADAGYFEALSITAEDRERTAQYQANRDRIALQESATDLPSYLRGLDMRMIWRPFDRIGLSRTVQLINKTNQFNLTTRRYTEDEVIAVMNDPAAFGLQLRLLDRFGDNGVIAIVIGKMNGPQSCLIDTWLMSCRVLGRGVESATLNLVAKNAARLGATTLFGEYRPTAKNGMVANHYEQLGFTHPVATSEGGHRSTLDLSHFTPHAVLMSVSQGD